MIKIDTDFAMRVKDKEVLVDGITYRFDASFYKRDGVPVLLQLTVDAYDENFDWDDELSECFEAGDFVPKDTPWIVA